MKPITREWVAKAEEDYVAALYLSRRRKASVPSIVCFHCQQCAEKYLKARLVEANISFPKTHNLTVLLRLVLTIDSTVGNLQAKLTPLNHYAVEFRYPGDESTNEEAKVALANCRAVRKEIRKILGADESPSAQMNLRIKEKRGRYKLVRKKKVRG